MMRSNLIIITFIFVAQIALAEDYLLYSVKSANLAPIVSLDPEASYRSLYSKQEKKILKQFNLDSEVIKLKTKLKYHQLSQLLPKIKIERTGDFQLNNHYENKQWALDNPGGIIEKWVSDIDKIEIQANSAEDLNLGAAPESDKIIKVAIIDSGVDTTHPDLQGQILTHPTECKELSKYKQCLQSEADKNICHTEYANKDTNHNGYPLDCQGWSFTNNSYPTSQSTGNPEIFDANGHGTHVAGIIAAKDNEIGVKGVLQQVKILPIQVAMNSAAENPIENMAKGVLYAIKNDVDVINLSLGWSSQFDLQLMRDLIAKAIERNIIVVVAAGNNAHEDISYPCAYNDVICVAAHDPSGELTSYSNRGTQVDVIAPGDRILSTWPTHLRSKQFTQDDNYEYLSGTSQAAPLTAGVIAKLLNAGVSKEDVFVTLAAGAREKLKTTPIRFGNVDFTQSIKQKEKSLLYPLNKTPFLIKWSEGTQHKFKLRLKNYGLAQKDIQLKVLPMSEQQVVINSDHHVSSVARNQELEIDIHFEDSDSLSSEIYFTLQVSQGSKTYSYLLKTQFIRLLESQSDESDIYNFTAELPSGAFALRPFENINPKDTLDYLIHRKNNNSDFISILKQEDDQYIRSRELKIRDHNPVILNMTKVDLDLDKKSDYVIMYVVVDSDSNKTTKFMIFDHNLKPKRIFICPDNTFNNQLTFMPGKFVWVNKSNRMMPAWVGYGEDPKPNPSPWVQRSNSLSNFLYILTPKGLTKVDMPDERNVLHLLYQSHEDKVNGHIEVITSKELGFIKQYDVFKLKETLSYQGRVQTQQFFDIFDNRPLPFTQEYSNAYFAEDSNQGSANTFIIKKENGRFESQFTRIKNPIKNESFKFVNLFTNRFIIFQTNHKLVLSTPNGEPIDWIDSKVDTRRRKYTPLLKSKALYLPAIESPGMTSEVVVVNNSEKLVGHRRYRVLGVNGCEEFGIAENGSHDYMGFVCKQDQKIKLIKINK